MIEKAGQAVPMVDCVDLDIMHTTAQEQLPVFALDLERVAADVSADGCWMMLPIKSTLSFSLIYPPEGSMRCSRMRCPSSIAPTKCRRPSAGHEHRTSKIRRAVGDS